MVDGHKWDLLILRTMCPLLAIASGLERTHDQDFQMASGETSQGEFSIFLMQALGQLADHSTDGSLHFIFMDWRHMRELLVAGDQIYRNLRICVSGPKTALEWVRCTAARTSEAS